MFHVKINVSIQCHSLIMIIYFKLLTTLSSFHGPPATREGQNQEAQAARGGADPEDP